MKIKKCNIEGCEKKQVSKGWCMTHYSRWCRHGDPLKLLRRQNGTGTVHPNGYIWIHKPDHPNATKNGNIKEEVLIMSQKLGRPLEKNEKVEHINGNKSDNSADNLQLIIKIDICSIEGCDKKCLYSNLYCDVHWRRYIKHGDPNITDRASNGVGHITPFGYRRIWKPEHPNSNAQGTILEHRFVMSEKLGRPLLKNENVHHINGDRLDNRPENLELWVKRQVPGQRAEDLLKYALEIIQIYGADIYDIKKKNTRRRK